MRAGMLARSNLHARSVFPIRAGLVPGRDRCRNVAATDSAPFMSKVRLGERQCEFL